MAVMMEREKEKKTLPDLIAVKTSGIHCPQSKAECCKDVWENIKLRKVTCKTK